MNAPASSSYLEFGAVTKNMALLLILVLTAPIHADNREAAAVKAIENLSGEVERDDKDPAHPVISVHFFTNQYVTDAALKELSPFKKLRKLDLSNMLLLTDAGLKELAVLKELRELDLSGCVDVMDAGLKDLAPLKELQTLNL
jgi:hypothetical protein